LLTFTPRVADPDKWSEELRAHLATLPGVERVEASPLRDELGRLWRGAGQMIIWPMVAFLCLMLGLVVGNTVRLTFISRQAEIDILRLVGATNWYIRLPLVSTGVLLGALGGGSGLALLWIARHFFAPLFAGPPLNMELFFPPAVQSGLLILVPALTGAVSAWLAVRRT
jgi:cell division transport system permease protein